MKIKGVSARLVPVCAVLAGAVSLVGCVDKDPFGTSARKPIQPAPAGMPNSGIGAPGGASEDTRSVGTVASSEAETNGGGPSVGEGSTSVPAR